MCGMLGMLIKERDNGVIVVVTFFISAQDAELLTISLCASEESP